ncbi:hypothetical protein BGAL_0177g00190 [Botrytis galanthina]|uniref:Uncharacterized protein n=1 Tax=Botrytis galanthina TaxID=278940 RepID=A0A4S8QWZ7_9HELO|nr:hypothetical protein BGAL_0177g00190 [Botrytis galanthina]
MSTSLTTGKTKQFTDSGQDNTKLLVLEQILKELRDVSSHLRKQETRFNSVENGLRERSKLVDGKPKSTMANGGITKGNTIQVYSNNERKIQIVDKTDEISSGNSTAVPLKHGIRGAISLPSDVMQIYHTGGIAFNRLGRKGGAYKVSEDGRLRLTFSTRWLLMLASSDDAQHHLDRIAHEEKLCQRLSGCRTTITDLFDTGQIIRYIIGAQESNTGSQNINCLDPAPTPYTVGTPNSRPLVGPWRRVISISCPEPRSKTLAQELEREDSDIRSQTIPCAVRRIIPMDRIIFQIKYFEIHSVKRDEYACMSWTQLKSGRLHSDKDFSSGMLRILLESSYQLIALADRGCKRYWTLLELKPLVFSQTISELLHSDGTPQNVLSTFFHYAINAVSHTIQKWEQILEYFDKLITEKIAFLDPLKHDNLLVGEETFSRSKRYFWAISTLKELDAVISDNLHDVSELINQREITLIEGDEVELVVASRKKMRQCLERLKMIARSLSDKRQEAIDIRDGLFNASGVMESRAATRLGENVKLLTFMSIFFLPLSFCMSVRSIDDEIFSLRSLEIVATVVGLLTYLIVFNLDNLMNSLRALHRRFVDFAISMMKTEASDTVWGKRASIYEEFSVQREIEHKPSDWRLAQYLLYRALGTIGVIGKYTALFKQIIQRLSLATIASMKEARNPIWRD